MAQSATDVIQEYVVKLGTMIDNEGVNKILSFLDSSKLKAIGLAGALAGATTAVYKFIETATKREFELEKLAKQQSKTVALVRAENSALKAMGKTLDEINRDEHLKKIYQDVLAFNKELALPNASEALRKVEGLQTSFYKLKSALGNAVQWINAQVITNLEAPIERITGKLEKGSNWLRDNMGRVSSKIGLFISDFAQGIIGLGEGIGKIFEFVNNLPDAIKQVGLAVAGVFAFFKGGTIGRILSLILTIGDFMQDYNNWVYNRDNGLKPGDEGYIRVAFGDLYEIISDESLDTEGKVGGVASRIIERLTNAFRTGFLGFDIDQVFGGGEEGSEGGILGAVVNWFNENQEGLSELGTAFLGWVTRGIRAVGATGGGAIATLINQIFGQDTAGGAFDDKDGSALATLGGAMSGFFLEFVKELQNPDSSVWDAFKKGLQGFSIGGIIMAFFSNFYGDGYGWTSYSKNGGVSFDFESAKDDLLGAFGTFFDMLFKGIDAAADIGAVLVGSLSDVIRGIDLGDLDVGGLAKATSDMLDKWSNNEVVMNGLTTSVAVLASGGNFWTALLSGVGVALKSAWGVTDEEKKRILKASGLGNIVDTLSTEDIDKEFEKLPEFMKKGAKQGLSTSKLQTAVEDFFTGIWETLLASASTINGLGAKLMTMLFQAFANLLGIALDQDALEDNTILGGIATMIGTSLAGGNFLTSVFAGLVSTITAAQEKVTENEDLFDVLKKDAAKFWDMILDIWEGPDENGIRNGDKGLKSVFKKLFFGEDGSGGLVDSIKQWLQPVGNAIIDFFDELWIKIYNSAPQWLRDAFGFAGIDDPNSSRIYQDEATGQWWIESTNGNKSPITEAQAKTLAPYAHFLSTNGQNEDGSYIWKFSRGATGYGENAAKWSKNFAFNASANELISAYINGETVTQGFFGQNQNAVSEGIAKKIFSGEFLRNAGTTIIPFYAGLRGDFTGTSLADLAIPQVFQTLINGYDDVVRVLKPSLFWHEDHKGGRDVYRFTNRENIAEAQRTPEYHRYGGYDAFYNALRNISEKASEDFGIDGSWRNKISNARSASELGQIQNTYNIQAPVTITVTADGASAESVAREVYSSFDRHLYNTLSGVNVNAK